MKDTETLICVPKDLHALIKKTARENGRTLVGELRIRFADSRLIQTPNERTFIHADSQIPHRLNCCVYPNGLGICGCRCHVVPHSELDQED